MSGRFTVLASGSSGNAALLEMDGFGLLIDCGLQPRTLTSRLRAIGCHWHSINAVILTHTHGDHWKNLTLADLRSRKIPLYGHAAHLDQLAAAAPSFDSLHQAKLTRTFAENRPLEVHPGLRVRPIRVSHDAEPTFGFRIDRFDGQGLQWSVGYASDLGCGSAELIEGFADVDVLALEYNHDIALERRSRRPQFLIDRVLSDLGHLSNGQAGELTRMIASQSQEGFPSHVIQLHLSRECNRPDLAAAAGRSSLLSVNPAAEVITARQDMAGKPVALERKPSRQRSVAARTTAPRSPVSRSRLQPSLPGFDDSDGLYGL
jgi:phosphoribosyl 1,2-cyclic phosphodiesterase